MSKSELAFRNYEIHSEAHPDSKRIVSAQNVTQAKSLYLQTQDKHPTMIWSDLIAKPIGATETTKIYP